LDVNDDCDIGYLDGAVIIGRTNTNIGKFKTAPHGIITPRSENYWIKNVNFFNFDFDGEDPVEEVEYPNTPSQVAAAAIGDCSHCYSDRKDATEAHARTSFFKGIKYNRFNALNIANPVSQVIRWQFPYKGIFFDEDCSMFAGNPSILETPPAPCWYTPEWKHNEDINTCYKTTYLVADNLLPLDGLYCSTPVRRLVLYNY